MEPLRKHDGLVYPLNRSNVDTDQIIPKQFLKRIERSGFGQFLFYHWRFDDNGALRNDFSLNSPVFSGASILIAGENFGCGSSREHAPWSLADYGFRVIIAPSFADIFYQNCFKNGLLPICLQEETQLLMCRAESGQYHLSINLEEQTITDGEGLRIKFDIPPYPREMLLNGLDEIGVTMTYEQKISQFEQQRMTRGA
ncbi:MULTISPECIES: 3-isopropylmalate dehydratase small subunit [unclassified Bacillus (in: firmicutes)]|uniref:3-isopropylmalate dehydratase small subunit n=1 Tax=unclassified Bacillus (in: firmicutes) TaxID=185979 RepID=UPI0008ECFF85|nr:MULTISPECIES: 3-isopropylmalate dehydratase small subunit [unclassified Bacillus (in: firmicutes)]SFB02901.1 3-isopropylmalate dehydratase, small subunit [Bacillus sp. UNCCL13]SFQ88951.1 3-isopropylmalate dehydratase, small subunit [Bacillus sp. cl95]